MTHFFNFVFVFLSVLLLKEESFGTLVACMLW
jgi:hypothetical protein